MIPSQTQAQKLSFTPQRTGRKSKYTLLFPMEQIQMPTSHLILAAYETGSTNRVQCGDHESMAYMWPLSTPTPPVGAACRFQNPLMLSTRSIRGSSTQAPGSGYQKIRVDVQVKHLFASPAIVERAQLSR